MRFTSKQHAESAGEGEIFREYNRAKAKRWRDTNPVAARRLSVQTNLKRWYGLTIGQYDELFARQKGRCAICEIALISQTDETRKFLGQPPNEVGRVDHDHNTHVVRGLLCFKCNTALGKFGDAEKLLLKAVRYLRESATAPAQPAAEREPASEIEPAMGPRLERCRGNRRDELSPFY